MEIIKQTESGKIVHGDNIEVLKELPDNYADSCISDFPYAIEFMGKNWDSAKHWNTGEGIHGQFPGTGYSGKRRPAFYANTYNDGLVFYDWCRERADELIRVMKPGGYVCIFGHPKTNHRMKCAFEDSGFKVVEEIDWLYLSGMPKNQDIGKLFDAQGEKEFAEEYSGWKTAGLKPAHEPATVFQKPLIGTYTENIKKYGCGGMNVDACRVATDELITNHSRSSDSSRSKGIYGDSREQETYQTDGQKIGRFPPNILLDESVAEELDKQTGITKSTGGSGDASTADRERHIYGVYNNEVNENYQPCGLGGYGDIGGGSRLFPIFKYCPKVSPQERTLKDGTRNPHVTLKPLELISWLIKLMTPNNGVTIDITAGSCTHAVACEQINLSPEYNIQYVDIELCNDEENPYCNIGKQRVEECIKNRRKRLF